MGSGKWKDEWIEEVRKMRLSFLGRIGKLNLVFPFSQLPNLQRKIPFAVVGSNTEVDTPDGRRVRGRVYPWGTIEVDNENHCDFVKLRQMLIRTHMEELKEHTHKTLYEKYRSGKLVGMGVTQDMSVFKEVNPAAKMAEERSLHEAKLSKMENEMKLVFQQKVAEKEAKLKQSEEELYARHREMRDALEKQRAELEDKKRRLESGRPLTPEKVSVSILKFLLSPFLSLLPLTCTPFFFAFFAHFSSNKRRKVSR